MTAATLVERIRARLDEEEAGARKLLVYAQQTSLTLQDPRHLGKFIPGWHAWPDVERMCIDRLAEFEAHRVILDELERWEPVNEVIVKALARAYGVEE